MEEDNGYLEDLAFMLGINPKDVEAWDRLKMEIWFDGKFRELAEKLDEIHDIVKTLANR